LLKFEKPAGTTGEVLPRLPKLSGYFATPQAFPSERFLLLLQREVPEAETPIVAFAV
jgi:hypothetical protein